MRSLTCILFCNGPLLSRMFAWRSSCESYSSNWSQNFCALPWNRYRFGRLDVLRYTTQLSYIFHYCHCTFVTTLLRPIVWLFLNLPVREWPLCAETYTPNQTCRIETREDANSQSNLVHVPLKKFLHGCRLVFPDGLLPPRLLFLDALLPLGVGGSEDGAVVGVDFARSHRCARSSVGLLSKNVLLLSTDSKVLFLFQYHLIPCDS